jgi:DNA-binding NarL/FixJ family response regulator
VGEAPLMGRLFDKIRATAQRAPDPGHAGVSDSKETAAIRVFLAIESRLMREMLARLLRRQGDLEVDGWRCPRESSAEEIAKKECDVVLADFVEREWLKGVREQGLERKVEVVVIGMEAEAEQFLEAVRGGVKGYLLKEASGNDVLAAVRAAARGEASCPARLCAVLFQAVAQMEQEKAAKRREPGAGLTLHQQKLMRLVARGMTNKEIAAELHLSEFTVKNHMRRLLKQLDAENRNEAVEAARQRGYELSL